MAGAKKRITDPRIQTESSIVELSSEFIRLPLSFDIDCLRKEVAQFEEHQWEYHPQGYQGNSALVLVSAHGGNNNDYTGPMQPTTMLGQCPYIQQVMAAFDTVIGRTRLMRLDPGASVPEHSDTDYSWRNRVRIHIPIVTDSAVAFTSVGNATVHMKAGEAWVFDNWKTHTVRNDSNLQRIHLVIDTTGTSTFWSKVRAGIASPEIAMDTNIALTHPYSENHRGQLLFETHNTSAVRNSAEIQLMCSQFVELLPGSDDQGESDVRNFEKVAADFCNDWQSLWLRFGDTGEGLAEYQALAKRFSMHSRTPLANLRLRGNDLSASIVLDSWLESASDIAALKVRQQKPANLSYKLNAALYDRPIFIVAAPRSGSTMFFELLKQNNDLWTIGDESHVEFESIRELHPSSRGFSSNALSAEDLKEDVANALLGSFLRKLQNVRGKAFSQIAAEMQPSQIRFLEKTPKNALRIPFLKALFPNAKFIFLHRDARQNIGSIIDAWDSGRFVTYPKLPGWSGPPWSLLLIEGWQELLGQPVAQIASQQWCFSNRHICEQLNDMPRGDWLAISYETLLNNRESTLRNVCEFADLPYGPRMQQLSAQPIPHSKYTLSAPSSDKWRRHANQIQLCNADIAATEKYLSDFLSSS